MFLVVSVRAQLGGIKDPNDPRIGTILDKSLAHHSADQAFSSTFELTDFKRQVLSEVKARYATTIPTTIHNSVTVNKIKIS